MKFPVKALKGQTASDVIYKLFVGVLIFRIPLNHRPPIGSSNIFMNEFIDSLL